MSPNLFKTGHSFLGFFVCLKFASILTFVLVFFIGATSLTAQVTPAEKIALQALYNALDGPNWTSENDADISNDWDFTQHVTNNWYGVTVLNGFVDRLELSNFNSPGPNNVSGTIPLSGTVPDFTAISASMNWLGITGNAFQFGDFENEFNTYLTDIGSTFNYSTQAKVDAEETRNLNTGVNTTMITTCSGTDNNYQWFKNDSPLANGGTFSGVNTATLSLNNLQLADAGVYHCEVTSNIVTGLTIDRNDITLNVTNTSNSLDDFVTTWRTAANNENITIPTVSTQTYSYTVDWGDGTTDTTVYTGDAEHVYTTAGDYQVRINGVFPQIAFRWTVANPNNQEEIISIDQWGTMQWASMSGAFDGCINVEGNFTDQPDLSLVENMSRMFNNATKFNGDVGNWDVSNVKYMERMFGSTDFFNQDLNWDVSNVLDMDDMFRGAIAFNGDISGWNVEKVTDMSNMFHFAKVFNRDISGWQTLALEEMYGMFIDTDEFNQAIGGWDVSKVEDLSDVFKRAEKFNQSLDNWDTALVNDMDNMFDGALVFNQDLSNWETGKVTDMSEMFQNAKTFNGNISNWDTKEVTTMVAMFRGANAFNSNIGAWETGKVIDMNRMFHDATVFNHNLNWDVTAVTDMGGMFEDASAFNGDITGWQTSSLTEMDRMFWDATAFNQAIGNWNTAQVTTMVRTFRNATSFDQNLANWNVESLDPSTSDRGARDMFFNVTLSTANYDALLIGWNAQNLPAGIEFSGGNSQYCLGETARNNMITSDGWTITDAGKECVVTCSIPQSEIDALMALYNATNGANWTSETDGDTTNDWDTTNPIENWFGLTIDCTNSTLTKIELQLNNLDGASVIGNDIPAEIGDLVNLQVLDLENNNLTGNIPLEIGNLTQLTLLDFHNNLLAGNIPTQLNNLINLEEVFLYTNALTGALPSDWGNIISLRRVYVNDNQLSGSVPNFSTLPGFTHLAIQENAFQFGDFENEFPSYVTNLGTNFTYNIQAKVDNEETRNLNTGVNTTMVTNCSGTDNSYQWFKDGVIISGAINASLILTNLQLTDAGIYHCEVTSGIVNGLTIERNEITLNITNTVTIPNCPTVNAPTAAQTGVSINPTITWTQEANATDYRVEVVRTSDGLEVFNQNVTNVSSYTLATTLDNSTAYEVTVFAINSAGEATGCSAISFTTEAPAVTIPNCPTITAPTANQADISINPTFTWNLEANATDYRVEVIRTSDGLEIFNQNVTNVSSYTLATTLDNSTAYEVTVFAINSAGEATGCSAISFTTEAPAVTIPNCPTITAPTASQTGVAINPTITWTQEANATDYRVEVIRTSDGLEIFNQNVTNVSSYTLAPALDYSTAYSVQIFAQNSAGEATSCTPIDFTTAAAPVTVPNCPTVNAPTANQVDVSINPTITWTLESSATDYRVVITRTLDAVEVLNQVTGNVDSYAVTTALDYSTAYAVQIFAQNSAGETTGCTPIDFTTAAAPVTAPNCPTVIAPTANQVDVSINPTITWTLESSATDYRVVITRTSDAVEILNQATGNVDSYAVMTALDYSTAYSVQIFAQNSAGEATGCAPIDFTTAAAPITIPNCTALTSPANGDSHVLLVSNLSWAAVGNATGYRISIGTTAGATDIEDSTEVGNATTYSPTINWIEGQTYFVTVIAYNTFREATNCMETSFTAETLESNTDPDDIPKFFTPNDIPKFFTPNNDGYHDYWNVIDEENNIAYVYIIDRFGKILAQISPESEGWDGTYQGKPMVEDDYWYVIVSDAGKQEKGHFSLIRR